MLAGAVVAVLVGAFAVVACTAGWVVLTCWSVTGSERDEPAGEV